MRIFYFLLVLSVSCCCDCQLIDGHVTEHLCAHENATVTTYALDEETVRNLRNEIETLNTSNELLRLRLEMITTRLDQQTESFNKLSAKLYSVGHFGGGNAERPVIDIRHGLTTSEARLVSNCTKKRRFPSNCAEAAALKRSSGIYAIQLDTFDEEKPFLVVCDDEIHGGGWTVIQRRMDGSVDFFRDWLAYKIGFGNLESEFFIGLDKLHAMTTENGPQELLIVMSDFDGVTKYAKYSSFAIGDESEAYALKVLGKYSGDASDSLSYHIGYKFTTKDKQHDINTVNCAQSFKGAWWYKNCHASNLNGLYLKGAYEKDKYAQGVVWFNWHGHYYSLKDVKMMIRPKRT